MLTGNLSPEGRRESRPVGLGHQAHRAEGGRHRVKRVVGDGSKGGESRPTDKRVGDGEGQEGGFGEALK